MKCIVCGKEINRSKYTNAVLCSSECYHINFWNEKVKGKDNPNIVRIDGTQYFIGDENSNSPVRGYCGRKFKIEKFNGQIIETTNLWYNGDIPEEFRSVLSDNAKFI